MYFLLRKKCHKILCPTASFISYYKNPADSRNYFQQFLNNKYPWFLFQQFLTSACIRTTKIQSIISSSFSSASFSQFSLIPFYFPINNILSDGGGKDCGPKAGCQGESEQTKELSFFVFFSNYGGEKMGISDENMIE